VLFIVSAVFFIMTMVFYGLTMINPGYVETQPNFEQLLVKLIQENYHLDYVCVPCETLRPEQSDHCNFCNKCVQKFDHHCVFVDNCLGYRNHKWFLLFLTSFTVYMIAIMLHSIVKLYFFARQDISNVPL
jgi:palmitoyltransferase